VDPANRHFGMNPFFHLVQASAFAPPFRASTFDLVFSHGVIHHTSSPKAAFERIARLPRPGGRLYVWVRSPVGERSSLGRRFAMGLEKALRPVCSRLPENLKTAVLLPVVGAYLVHQNLLTERTNGAARYRWREAVHAARDRFTAPFAHRFTEEEVLAWFQDAGYTALRRASQRRNVPSCVPENFLAHTAIDGMRLAVPGKTPVVASHAPAVALSR
jgi:SAM-dependent methyltransferase